MATDFLLSGVTLFLGRRLIARARQQGQSSVWFWAGAFLASSAAALAGGMLHGLKPFMEEANQTLLWKSTVYAVGLASFFMLSGTIMDSVSYPVRQGLLALAFGKFLLYSFWMISHNDFLFVIYDYGGSLAGVLLLKTCRLLMDRGKDSIFIISGVLASLAAARVQQSAISLDAFFNHNDLYHLIQTGAFYLFYRGVISQGIHSGSSRK